MVNYLKSDDTLWFHLVCLTVCWNIFANIAIIAAVIRHTIKGYYVHAILSWIIVILTFICTLIYIIPHGIPQLCTQGKDVGCDPFQFPLSIEGSFMTFWLLIQIGSGMLSRYWQANPYATTGPLTVIRSKRFHRWSGYFLLVLGKFNCFVHWRNVP